MAKAARTRAGSRSPDVGSADVDPADGRDETEDQRMDRNWGELLQELRVTQTGTQILFGFLLAIAFQPRFASLNAFERTTYLILITVAAVTTVLALAPVSMHRGLFRLHLKRITVRTGHVILRCALAGVGLVLVGTILLIFEVATGLTTALWVAGGLAVLIVVLAALPAVISRTAGHR